MTAAVPAAAVIAVAWLRFEQPSAGIWRGAVLVVLALAAAAVPGRWWRAGAVAVAAVPATWLAFGVWLLPLRPLDPASGFGLGSALGTLTSRFGNGFLAFYAVHLPFDPRVETDMAALVLAAIFCFAILVGLLAAARRPVAAALALLAGAGWPATLLGPSHGIAIGAAILVAGLILLAGLGPRRLPALALPAVAVVVLAAIGVGTATAARHGLVHWQSWNPTRAAGRSASVNFVWSPQYGGLDWRRRPTVVLEVQASQAPGYLRATVLDDFGPDAWAIGPRRPADSLEPAAALRPGNESREVVTVEGLIDTHLAGGSVPVRFAAGGAPLVEPERGFAVLPGGLARDFRYTVWSYTPRPTVTQLRRSPPDYPAALSRQGLLSVGEDVIPPAFGVPDRERVVSNLLSENPGLYRYLPLAQIAERVAGRARTPYDAVAALERWFLVGGGFRYSNHPPVVAPPLVGFVTRTRSGYCQFFAGAMALMLRYIGIPARVAVGFSGGTYAPDRNAWLITDHDAHAWVEVWFKGYGWLPFDPTPAGPGSTRGPIAPVLAGSAETVENGSSPSNARKAAKNHGDTPASKSGKGRLSRSHLGRLRSDAAGASGGQGRGAVFLLLLLVVAAVGGAIAATKLGLRLVRRLERDPRRIAAAGRAELAAFLVDQGIETAGSATLRELGELVSRRLGVEPERFVAAATAARFGRDEDAAPAARVARRELRALLRSIRRRLTRRERLAGLLSLRSLAGRAAALDGSASRVTGS